MNDVEEIREETIEYSISYGYTIQSMCFDSLLFYLHLKQYTYEELLLIYNNDVAPCKLFGTTGNGRNDISA